MATFPDNVGVELPSGEWQVDIWSTGGAGTAALEFAADATNYRTVDVSSQYSGTGSGGFTIKVGAPVASESVPLWRVNVGGDAVASYFKIS
jgi:hypothetical protein